MSLPGAMRAPSQAGGGSAVDTDALLAAMPSPVFALDGQDAIRYANPAAQALFQGSGSRLVGMRLQELLPADAPLLFLIALARSRNCSLAEHGVSLDSLRTGARRVTVQIAPPVDPCGLLLLTLQEHDIARRFDTQMSHRGAARSVTAMAAMLAHEVKNPLSGIRGAAQLLEQTVEPQDRELTRLIREEADRIVALVDRMEIFADPAPVPRSAVNIHDVLDHVRRVAENGFARGLRFQLMFDPSLPDCWGHRDELIQIFMNLVKNACEAVPQDGRGLVTLRTAWAPQVRLTAPGTEAARRLPLLVTVEDNGDGVPADLLPHLFDPFVTTKAGGRGLGLALVAKLVHDHGGAIDCHAERGATRFLVSLPIAEAAPGEPASPKTPGTGS